ncbi:hypothetical protein LSAT2_007291 [Lamellibrachia satsuma]|nr:hypothetical protein LSAT2_007291 [Lamellibrachia satsuma]
MSSQSDWQFKTLFDPVIQSLLVDDLELFHTYEFRIHAFNMFGNSGWSAATMVYLEIDDLQCAWIAGGSICHPGQKFNRNPAPVSWNGDPVGYAVWRCDVHMVDVAAGDACRHVTVPYPLSQAMLTNLRVGVTYEVKVYYWLTGEKAMTADMRRVPTTDMHVMLTGQRMYTQYQVTLLAFNAAAGDGPNMSRPLEARTNEGVPGQPGELQFAAMSMTSLNVSWAVPVEPNGIIECRQDRELWSTVSLVLIA